ncbi:MAG: hypothetical protein ACOC7W_03055, partial [Desulfosalsimonas sp.]
DTTGSGLADVMEFYGRDGNLKRRSVDLDHDGKPDLHETFDMDTKDPEEVKKPQEGRDDV